MPSKKPRYKIPTVKQISKLAGSNGLTAVSLFAGAGGSSTGYRWAGFAVPYINEFLPAAQESYAANWPETHIDGRDIRAITGKDITKISGPVDLLDGSPPCKAFSLAGARERHWGEVYHYADGKSQRNDDLVLEYVRIVTEVKPRAFVMENVKGLTIGVSKGYFKEVYNSLTDAGYQVASKLLNSRWLGVPQNRVRVFIIGIRNDLKLKPRFPTPLPYFYSLNEATGHNLVIEYSPGSWAGRGIKARRDGSRAADTFMASGSMSATDFRVIDQDTSEKRKLTIDELKAISGFPPDYQLTGSLSQQRFRIGEAVTPPVTKAVGSILAEQLNQ